MLRLKFDNLFVIFSLLGAVVTGLPPALAFFWLTNINISLIKLKRAYKPTVILCNNFE